MYKVYIETLGCPKNQVDSETMLGLYSENDYEITNDPFHGDIIIVNTCGFIESAKKESLDTIMEMIDYKENGNCKILIVSGCLIERYAEELKEELPEVDAFVGTTSFENIIEITDKIISEKKFVVSTGNIDKILKENAPRILQSPDYYAFLKISEGCDNLCTYCIIPKLRGKYRSRQMDDIITEAKKLVESGVKELILIAQDTTRYGIDIYGEYSLYKLLQELEKIENLQWIRIQYCYPDIVDDKLIDEIARNTKVVKYLDIPIQHSSDKILKLMKRNTSREQICNLIEKLREKVDKIAIRTTLITGFPGETEEDVEDLINFIKEYKFDKLGVFTYSNEEGTAAYNLPDHVDEETMEERKVSILQVQQDISTKNLEYFMKKTVDVLIEEKVPEEDIYIGRSQYDAPEIDGVVYVHCENGESLEIGDIVKCKVNDTMEYDLIGVYVDESCE